MACLCFATTAAAGNNIEGLSLKYEKNYENVLKYENAAAYAEIAAGENNTSFSAGCFDSTFVGTEAIGVSAFLTKNDAQMQPLWTVVLQGSAYINAMTSDKQGGVYVAGQIADEVILGSADGNTKTVAGYQVEGEYSTDQVASFLAHYDSNGNLLAATTIVPETDDNITAALAANPEGAFLGYNECYVTDLNYVDGQLYATIGFYGKISTTDGSKSIHSGSVDAWGMGYYMSVAAQTIATIGEQMEVTGFPIILKSRDISDNPGYNDRVYAAKVDFNDGHAYIAFNALGTMTIATDNASKTIEYSTAEAGFIFGYGLADINLADGSIANCVSCETVTTDEYISTEPTMVKVVDNKIVTSGYFQGNFGFQPSLTAVGNEDNYVAVFNKSDLSFSKAVATSFDEGENYEGHCQSIVIGNVVYISGECYDKNEDGITPLFFTCSTDCEDLKQLSSDTYIYGMAASDDAATLYTAGSNADLTDAYYAAYEAATTGISKMESEQAEAESFYDLTGRRVTKPTHGIYVKKGAKRIF